MGFTLPPAQLPFIAVMWVRSYTCAAAVATAAACCLAEGVWAPWDDVFILVTLSVAFQTSHKMQLGPVFLGLEPLCHCVHSNCTWAASTRSRPIAINNCLFFFFNVARNRHGHVLSDGRRADRHSWRDYNSAKTLPKMSGLVGKSSGVSVAFSVLNHAQENMHTTEVLSRRDSHSIQ